VDFVRLQVAPTRPPGLELRVGQVRLMVERGFDATLLREVVETLA